MSIQREYKMKVKQWVTAGLYCLLIAASSQAASDKPNILVIWGDDIGVHNISAYNNGIMACDTPNIDRIASEGTTCRHL